MKNLLILGAMAFCLCVHVCSDTQSGPQGDTTLPEEDGVLQLKQEHFKRALRKYKQLLVHFSHRVTAAFKDAAEALMGSEVKLGVVDVTQEKDLVKELNGTSYPMVRLYISGDIHNPVPCPDPQSSASILTWLRRRSGSAADLITDLIQFGASEELMVVGFFKELTHAYVQVFHAAAVDLPDITFALTQNEEVSRKYRLSQDVVLLLKKLERFMVQLMILLFNTIKGPSSPLLQTASQILNSPVLNHALLFVNKSSADFEEISSAFSSAAEKFRMKILFVLVNVAESRNGRLMEYFRVRDFEAPLIRLVNLTDHVTYHLPSDTLNVEVIQEFCQSYLDGKAKPKMQSEPIPEGWDQKPVKELVGMNLEQVAFNPDKTVFVLFYLPYSKASLTLFPLWEELAEAFREREDVVFARIDASANDINLSTQGAYPSLCLFPALYTERMVIYRGKRKLKDLVRFVDKEMEKAKKYRVKVNHLFHVSANALCGCEFEGWH
uniref:Zgc:136472 n=1 Tax=Oryzias latipes TaxID=8090 RepID=A0A3B3IGK5_ORYLA